MLIEGACVTIAMFCLIQFYYQIRVDVAEHRPLLKIVAIKLVIFLSFWQTVSPKFSCSSPIFAHNRLDRHLPTHLHRRLQSLPAHRYP